MEKEFSSISFQILILKYLWWNQKSSSFRILLKEKYFSDLRCAYFFKWFDYLIKSHGFPVSNPVFYDICKDDKAVKGILKVYDLVLKAKLEKSEESYVETKVIEFCRYQEVLDVLTTRAVSLVESGNLDALHLELNAAFSIGKKQFNIGMEYFDREAIHKRIKDRLINKKFYRTWISELDRILSLRSGQLAIILGVTGKGKTMFLVYLAKVMMMQKLNVVFYTLQLPEDAIAARLDASMSNLNMSDLKSNHKGVISGISKFKSTFRSRLIIKGFPSKFLTVEMFKSHLDLLRSSGFSPDVVIIDYGNLMIGGDRKQGFKNPRHEELGLIYEQLMAVSQEQDLLTLVAHQVKASAWDKPLVTIADAAESSETVMVSPLVISINRSLEEEKTERARIYICKNSYGPDGIVVSFSTDYKKGQFYVPYRPGAEQTSTFSASSSLSAASSKRKKGV